MDSPCNYRGSEVIPLVYSCQIHGRCSIGFVVERVRDCQTCVDRYQNNSGNQLKKDMLLGDAVEKALQSVGITKDRISNWLGVECNCEERKQKLNQLHSWAKRVLSGKAVKPKEHLEEIIS